MWPNQGLTRSVLFCFSASVGLGNHEYCESIKRTGVTSRDMRQMPVRWESTQADHDGPLKPYLLLALTVAVLAFCTTLLVR